MAVIGRPFNETGISLWAIGLIIAVFSLAIGSLVLFVVPSACTIVGSLQLGILGLFFVLGLVVFLVGLVWQKLKLK